MARPLSKEAEKRALDAAVEVLSDGGVNGFTVDEVSRRSGVAKSTIYRHWASRAELLVRALDQFVVPFSTPDTGSLRTDLTVFIESVISLMEEDGTRNLLLGVLDASARDPEFERIQGELMAERRRPVVAIVELAQARREIDPDLDPELAVDLIEGPFFLRMVMRNATLPRDSVAQVIDLLMAALTQPRRSAPA